MLIDGIVKRYPKAMVELDTPYFIGKTKVLCMDNPVQDIINGNILFPMYRNGCCDASTFVETKN